MPAFRIEPFRQMLKNSPAKTPHCKYFPAPPNFPARPPFQTYPEIGLRSGGGGGGVVKNLNQPAPLVACLVALKVRTS